jgi:competence protein ComEC
VLSPHTIQAGLQKSSSNGISDNNSSCVVLIDAGGQRLLLTGDIEKEVEQYLVRSEEDIRADVLLSPHHGSKTSSSGMFLDAVGARHVIVSAGFRNRFHHPADSVLARYRASGMAIHNTAESGAVRIKLSAAGVGITSALCGQHFLWRLARYNMAGASALCRMQSGDHVDGG